MTDIINLLPDSVANQIAAGEVIQRPASAVKELMENAIDAGATEIKLIIKDSGKGLIQVIDNGCGMSPTDARMSFARHATSKINKAEDLFNIRTMGFRGEALASIAAIAQVEVKTKRIEDNIGTHIIIEGTQVVMQEEIVCNNGTVFTIKNLFYNTPARRNFLKSNNVELRHIQDVFIRIAIVNPQIAFVFFDDNRQKFNLPKGIWKQRVIDIFGKALNHKMLNIEESTEVVNISGFIGKPETARKTRGEQYFFVNKRFIKHPYLNHAVQNAYEELIPDGAFPSYFINFDVDPQRVDINIHPTKTEVNFQDEKAIYGLLRAAVKMTLGKFAFTPILDFEAEMSFNPAPLPAGSQIKQPEIQVNPDYNPFETNRTNSINTGTKWEKPATSEREQRNINNWQKMYEEVRVPSSINHDDEYQEIDNQNIRPSGGFFQIANEFIAFSDENGLWLIHQQLAHERILYDRFAAIMENTTPVSQQKLFPETIQFSNSDMDLINELWDEIHALGFMIEKDENNDIQVNGAPPEFNNESIKPVLEGMLEHYKNNQMNLKIDKQQNILLSMAKNLSVKSGRKLSQEEINALMEAYFDSKQKDVSPSGRRIISQLTRDELIQKFI